MYLFTELFHEDCSSLPRMHAMVYNVIFHPCVLLIRWSSSMRWTVYAVIAEQGKRNTHGVSKQSFSSKWKGQIIQLMRIVFSCCVLLTAPGSLIQPSREDSRNGFIFLCQTGVCKDNSMVRLCENKLSLKVLVPTVDALGHY